MDSQVGIQLNVKGAKETEDALKKVGTAAKGFETNTNSLGSALTKLGVISAILYGAKKTFDFFVSTTQDALAEAKVLQLLNGAIKSVGLSLEETKPKVDDFAKSMRELGVDDELTYTSISKLLKRTGDLDKAMEYSKLASDLASSGINDYATNTDLLNRILMGVGSRALIQFGVHMKDNATIAEQMIAVQGKVTQTTKEWSLTAEGQIAIAKTAWNEVREDLGAVGAITLVNLSNAFTKTYNQIGTDTVSLGKFLAEFWNVGIPTVFTQSFEKITSFWGNFYQGMANLLGNDTMFGKKYQSAANAMDSASSYYKDKTIEIVNSFDAMWDKFKGKTGEGQSPFSLPEEEVGEEADKIKKAFESLAKTITSKIKDSTDKITGLRNEIKQLGQDTEDQVNKQEKLHQKDLANLARSTQDKINEIDTQITDAKNKREQGWRDEVAKLESEKTKELAVLSRIGEEGIAIQDETQKDALTLLEEGNAERIQEIRDNAEIQRLEKEKAILEEQVSMTQGAVSILSPVDEKQKDELALNKMLEREKKILEEQIAIVQKINSTPKQSENYTFIVDSQKKEMERLEKEKQDLIQQIAIKKDDISISRPSGLSELMTKEMATPTWETPPSQSIFNINIEGTVTSEGELFKKIQEALNRASSLKLYGGTQ